MASLIEEYRKLCIDNLFNMESFKDVFAIWKSTINSLTSHKTPQEIFDLGDNLRDIFFTTNTGGRSQGAVSAGGTCWEALICWYLNLCNIGRRTIVIKHAKELIPDCVSDAITVNYGNFPSNTESDLIAITFPDEPEYDSDYSSLSVIDFSGNEVPLYKGTKINLKEIINVLAIRDFSKLEINIIQCKTNWNDNAQIPMLWDMIYSANAFRTNITIGRNGYSITGVKRFAYSFATLPSNKNEYKSDSVCVKRVENLSGGNYWGMPTKNSVAASLKELLTRNLGNGKTINHLSSLAIEIPKLSTDYSYFKL